LANQITCATKVHAHRHITEIGGPNGSWTVAEVRALIARGVQFETVSPSTGRRARVLPFDCQCGVKSLRSAADAVKDNNLDNLPNCP
jgi:hypothetical protein